MARIERSPKVLVMGDSGRGLYCFYMLSSGNDRGSVPNPVITNHPPLVEATSGTWPVKDRVSAEPDLGLRRDD